MNNTVVAPNEWWDSKQQENPPYAKFRYKGLPFAHELTTLFKDVVDNGEYTWAPSCGVLPSQLDNDDNGVAAIEEGSGDNEDAREIFISLRGSEEKKLNWLKHADDNPLAVMNM